MIQEPETLYKLMILYMLDKVNFPITNSQLSKFFLDKEYTSYFTLQSVLNELDEANLIDSRQVGNSTHYEITDDGKEALKFFASDISSAAVADINDYLEENKFSIRKEAGVIAEYFPVDDLSFMVHCSAREGKTTLFAIDISVPDEKLAKDMCSNWRDASQKIYSFLLAELLKDKQEKEPPHFDAAAP